MKFRLNVRYEQIRIMADCDEQAMKAYAEIKKNHEIYQKQIDEMKKQSKSGEMVINCIKNIKF